MAIREWGSIIINSPTGRVQKRLFERMGRDVGKVLQRNLPIISHVRARLKTKKALHILLQLGGFGWWESEDI